MRLLTPWLASIAIALTLPLTAQAHRNWILPSSTVVSGDNPWVTFDAAGSNDIFHADHAPLRIETLTIIAPDGKTLEPQNLNTGKFRVTFDLNLQQKGTYKVGIASNGLTARWETEAGERRFWPERGKQADPEDFKKSVPKKAKNLEVAQTSRRNDTFVTSGSTTTSVFKPINQGLEFVPITHPNDLFADEKAEFSFLIDGTPAVGTKVTVIPSNRRYRNHEAEQEFVTDKDGKVSITWPQAGTYWLSASYRDEKAKKPAKIRNGSYVVTLEVLPK